MASENHAHGHDHGDHHDDGAVHAHISSTKFYVGILGALMFFTLLTVGVASVHLGPLNLAVAVVIASIKATLVVLFFMHIKYDNRFNGTIVICSLMFIGVFFAYTMNDTDRRGELDEAQGTQVLPSTGQAAPGGMKGTFSPNRSHENAPSALEEVRKEEEAVPAEHEHAAPGEMPAAPAGEGEHH
jgi:cytochrome c oxidase subunit 4